MTLLEIAQVAKELAELVQTEDIDEQTRDDTLESIGANDKVETYCQVITEIKGEIAAIKAQIEALQGEEDRLLQVVKRKESAINSMRYRLGEYIDACGGEKQKGITYTAYWKKTSAVKITDESALPSEYMTVKTTSQPNKAAIKAALDAGQIVPGAEIEITKGVQIR